MEVSTNLGRVSIVPKGEYNPAVSYERLDAIRYEGSTFLVLRSVQGVTPEDGADYMMIAERGQNGEDGEPGQDGAPGNGIANIERTSGTGAAGTTDTYTITMTDGSTSTFEVYNGADGTGAGDMTKSVYDTQGKNTDIFEYVDSAVENVEVEVDAAPTEDSPNPVSSGGAFTAISTKQPILTGQPGQVVGFDAAGSALAVRGWSNPNLLDNSYWANKNSIVNQRGQEEYTSAGYTIDRCYIRTGTKVTIEDTGIRISQTENDAIASLQIPILSAPLFGKTVTLSALVDEVQNIQGVRLVSWLGDGGGNQTTDASISGGYTRFSEPGLWSTTFRVRDDTTYKCLNSCLRFEVGRSNLSSIKVRAMKLELGSQQTLAHQDSDGNWVLNDPPPDYATELAKCQRYQIELITTDRTYGVLGNGWPDDEFNATIFVPLPVSMRSRPTVSFSGNFYLVRGIGNYNNGAKVTGFSVQYVTANGISLFVQTNGTLTSGLYTLTFFNGTNSILLDSNL